MENYLSYLIENGHFRKIVFTLIYLIFLIILTRLSNRVLFKTIKDNLKFHKTKRVLNYMYIFLYIIILFVIWFDSGVNLTTYFGLLSAGIAIALRELFSNVAAWFFITLRRPFEIGHRVEIGQQKGDVIDIRVFQFTLMEVSPEEDGEQSTGRIIDVPNYFVFIHPVINFTKGFEYIWHEIKVLVTFESNWEKTKSLLSEIINEDAAKLEGKMKEELKSTTKKYVIKYNKLTPIVYTDVKDSGVEFTMRYLCSPKQKRTTQNKIWEDVLRMLKANDDIDLAYPTKRLIN